ncbi:hypothetical protein P5673_013972, partial [Acropora cervicornis]
MQHDMNWALYTDERKGTGGVGDFMSQKEFNTDYVNKYVKVVKHKLEFAFSHLARFVYNISTFGRHFECSFGTSFPACQDNLRLPKPPQAFPRFPFSSQVCLNIMALALVLNDLEGVEDH